ncbi:MAG: phospholipase D-like domain-containing protein [Chloroflexota bacterium]
MPRRRRRRQSGSLLTLIIIIIAWGVMYYQTGSDPLGIFPPIGTRASTTAAPAEAPPPAGGNWWEAYFTDPVNMNDPAQWQNSIEARLIDKIDAAQTSIHIAAFEFNLTPVAEALIAARQRGVDVRWVTDDESGLEADEEPGRGQFAMLTEAGIEVRSDARTALMHNKFWIFDGQSVWTGSTNITENGIFDQDNNVIVIQSTRLAAIYEAEFQEMWDGQFGPRSPSQLAEQSLTVNGSDIHVVFTSEDPAIEQAIIPIVNSAQHSIRFLAFSFTDYPLADAIIQRHKSGVDVAGVIEKVGSDGEGAELKTMFCEQVPVRRDGNSGFMHNKIIVVDERYVITGSMNYSTSAEESNDENVIIIDNPEIARLYMQEFNRIWALATMPEPEKFPCE